MSKEFYQGFGMAVAAVAREHGMPSVAVDIMNCNGVSLMELEDAGLEEFDLKPLREEWLDSQPEPRARQEGTER